MSFYLTLPSNSSLSIFPFNNQSQFTTNLPQEINLEGQWEVGLAEIQFNNNYTILENDLMYITIKKKHFSPPATGYTYKNSKISIKGGFFASSQNFIDHLNDAIKNVCGKDVFFDYSTTTNKATLVITNSLYNLRMSHPLMEVLGLEHTHIEGVKYGVDSLTVGAHTGVRNVDIYQNFKAIFIYCDLVQPRPCGDVMTPLLRTLPLETRDASTYHKIFVKPHYIPLSRQTFRSLEILLSTDRGEPLSFAGGHTIATLHFRRSKIE